LTSELNVLIKRIQPQTVKPTEEPPEPSKDMFILLQRIENRKWRDSQLMEILARLVELKSELNFIDYALSHEEVLFELSIDITRYDGTHSGLWYLDLQNEMGFYPEIYEEDPLYKTAPRIDKYHWGSYWEGENHDEAVRFIKDRMKWAKPLMQREAEALVDYYVILENWDLMSPIPSPPEHFLDLLS